MKKLSFLLFLAFALVWQLEAQIETPALSPSSKIEQQVGLTDVTIEYSRPSARGRTIFGDLVPYGTMWRTGANASTKVTFSTDVKVAGQKLEAGTYALYTIPGKDEWTVIFHKNLTYWGTGGDNYKTEEDALRVNVPAISTGDYMIETFTMEVSDISSNGANIGLWWETTGIVIPVMLNTQAQVQQSIDAALAGPSGRDYYAAAQYYFTEGIDNGKALKWINMAIDKDYGQFWVLKLKSEIQAANGDVKGAIETANKSMKAAQEANNANYVKMNKDNIAKWSM